MENSKITQLLDDVKEKFSTITIDTVDLAWDACEKYICAQNPNDSGEIPKALGEIPWGKRIRFM